VSGEWQFTDYDFGGSDFPVEDSFVRHVDENTIDCPKFEIKDSGKRASFSGGMVRDVTEGKVDTLLTRDGPMFWRWAQHLTNGAKKYAKRNWMLAAGTEEYERFRESAARHFEQWLRGDTDEDHAAAVYFNINGAEYVKRKLDAHS